MAIKTASMPMQHIADYETLLDGQRLAVLRAENACPDGLLYDDGARYYVGGKSCILRSEKPAKDALEEYHV